MSSSRTLRGGSDGDAGPNKVAQRAYPCGKTSGYYGAKTAHIAKGNTKNQSVPRARARGIASEMPNDPHTV
jgi:hypothetical protein